MESDETIGPADRPEPDDRESAYALLRRGAGLSTGRHYAQAAIVLSRADRLEPGKGSILEMLGRAYFMSRQWEPAADTFERLVEVDPSGPYGHYALGQSLKRLGRIRGARTHLRLAVALSPGSRLYREAYDRLPPDDPAT
jgi:Flp pilus assembly protein TadD